MVKRVAYLIGSGATEGAAKFHGFQKSLLMEGLQDDISELLRKKEIPGIQWAMNELETGANLERLVSLFEYSGTSKHLEIAKVLRKAFRTVLEKRIGEISKDFIPELMVALVDMHRIKGLEEEVVAIFTTNYEDLIERSVQKIHGGINYPIQVIPNGITYPMAKHAPPILKLHGSFNWKSEYPISFAGLGDHDDGIWIPPGVMKRKESYPFNILWGKAKELLDCDILRIIGSSLSQNDWELVALISIAQGMGYRSEPAFSIELINSPRTKNEIVKTHHYLDVVGLDDIPEVREYIKKTYYPIDTPVDENKFGEALKLALDRNQFELWLRAKGEKMLYDDISLDTESNDFKDFISRGLGGESN